MTSETRVPEVELVKFLSEILVRQPARHRRKGRIGPVKRMTNGELLYPVFRLLERDYDKLCQLTNEVRREFGWEYERFRREEDE